MISKFISITKLIRRFKRISPSYTVMAGSFILMVYVVITIFAPYISPYHPVDYTEGGRLQPPGRRYYMGTDQHGRDVFSRTIYGARPAMMVALTSTILALLIGMPAGLLSGFLGGKLDRVLALVADSVYAFPSFILAITVAAVLGPGIVNMSLAVTLVYIPIYFRVVRSRVLQIREETYVEAARALGAPDWKLLWKYIAPNTISSIIAIMPFNIADAILTETGLSFLGFGIEPPTPDWGFDISNAKRYFLVGKWWTITFPGIMIIFLVVGFSLLGEGLSDILNPRLRKR